MSTKPPVQKQRPWLMRISQTITVYAVLLALYAEYWHWQRPELTRMQVCHEFWIWTTPVCIMLIVSWYIDDRAYWQEYADYEKRRDNK